MDNETKTRVLRVLKKITGRELDHIDPNADLKSQLALDSIQVVELFAALENEFNVELPLNMMTVRSANVFMKMLDEQLNK